LLSNLEVADLAPGRWEIVQIEGISHHRFPSGSKLVDKNQVQEERPGEQASKRGGQG